MTADETQRSAEKDAVVSVMPLIVLLDKYRDGDEHGWATEFDWIRKNHREILDRLMVSIEANGIREPVSLGNDGRVWDGHHRLCAAWILGITDIPVRVTPPASTEGGAR